MRAATARFKSTEAAEAAGYKRVTDCVEHQPAGAMGYHFQNNALLDTTLDVDHPEVLVYERKPDGGFKLNGVEFLVPISAWTATEPPRIMGQALKRADRLGIWYLHVWTWEPSPSGLFADWNPRVKCGTERRLGDVSLRATDDDQKRLDSSRELRVGELRSAAGSGLSAATGSASRS